LGFLGNLLANALIFCLLGFRWLNYGYFPLSNLYESLMFLAWGITTTSILIEYKTLTYIIGSISSPITLFVVGFASLSLPDNMQAPSPLVPALKSNWLMMHVTVMMLSYASLIVGSLLGVLFLILTQGKKENIVLQGNSYGNNFSSTNLGNTAFYKDIRSKPTLIFLLRKITVKKICEMIVLVSLKV
jgi:cytochrome c-type biogenesis protein CcsB